ncbi:MAG TPA: hypothetical protein VJY33_22240 [Isosphaeraceae bacterium]|nr:hypothetical protein [Isosphaeraceae bacterium]
MFVRFKFQARKFGLFLRAVLIVLLAMLTGCDKKVEWRGVGTDSKDADHFADQQAPQRKVSDVKTR